MRIELLVDSEEFWRRLQHDLEAASSTAYLQTFSFEGDRAGSALGRRLEESRAADRRLLVDGYTLLSVNDRVVQGPAWLDRTFRKEVFLTHRWVRRLQEAGVGVKFGNPVGPWPAMLLRRSHKKLAVFDDRVAYLGGINFSDHNFEWHDMMLRVEDEALARHLADDFRRSWESRSVSTDRDFGRLRVLSLNGRGNPRGFAPVLEAIDGAERTLDVVSAYLSPPFTTHLARAAGRGVRVRILTPARNNKPNLARFIRHAACRHGFEILLYPDRMNHMKAMMVDGETLVAGSSNFDAMSFHILEELFVITSDAEVLDVFKQRVWKPDVAVSRPWTPERTLSTGFGYGAVHAAAGLARVFALS